MNAVTLSEIKMNLRIENDLEDERLTEIGETAEAMVCNIMERDFTSLYDQYGTIPTPVKHAILCLCDHLFTHTGIASTIGLSAIPYTIDAMLKPYIKLIP